MTAIQFSASHQSKSHFLDYEVIWEFERGKRLNIHEVDTGSLEGKRVRAESLVRLKERAGLKYREIAECDIFGDLGLSSLRAIYKNHRNQ